MIKSSEYYFFAIVCVEDSDSLSHVKLKIQFKSLQEHVCQGCRKVSRCFDTGTIGSRAAPNVFGFCVVD
jgi:hypothetical protein